MASPNVCTADSSSPSSDFRRYQIRQRLFTLGNNFTIKDESGQHLYTVRSKLWTRGRKLVLEDMSGNGLIKIHQKPFKFLDSFNILSARNGESDRQLASVRQKFTFFKHKYTIYSVYGDYILKGLDVFDHSFTIRKTNGQPVVIVNKKFFAMADTYGVEMIDSNGEKSEESRAFFLSLVIVLHCSLYSS